MCSHAHDIKSQDVTTIVDEVIPTLKPDHVSLGKCAACHQFIHHYSSVNHSDIVDLLRCGCKYNGFKNIAADSAEEEGFVNMHHVLLLSSLDADDSQTKELCVQRINDHRFDPAQLKNENIVVSDNDSVVILVHRSEEYVDAFYFGKCDHSCMKLEYPETDFDITLTRDVLFFKFDTYMLVVRFHGESSYIKNIKFNSNIVIMAASNLMLVTNDKSDGTQLLHVEHFDTPCSRDLTIPSTQSVLTSGKIAIFSVFRKTIWLSVTDKEIYVYSYSRYKDLSLLDTIAVNSCVCGSDKDDFTFVSFCMSHCSMQGFLLYIRKRHGDWNGDKNSLVLVMDLKTLKVVSVLEMELTMNREPQLKMYPSRDGSKLFVQERFENRVIFYQVFSLLPTNFCLYNIVKQFIWKKFSKDCVLKSHLSNHLIEEIMEGF